MTLVGTALNFVERMKIYPRVLTFFIMPQIWLFHVAVLLTTAKKRTKVKSASARRAKLFVFAHQICTFATFWLPSSLSLLKGPQTDFSRVAKEVKCYFR